MSAANATTTPAGPGSLLSRARAGQPLPDCLLLDAHAHLGRWATFDACGPGEQVAEMDRVGIRRAVTSSLLALAGDVRAGNDQVAAALRQFPDRLFGYVHVNANFADDMLPELERCFAVPGFVGIKVYQRGVAYDAAAFRPVWDFARDRVIPVLAHTWGENLTGLDVAAREWPTVPFLLGHAGSGMAYRRCVEVARQAPNLYLDLTLSREYPGLIEHFVEQVGPERLVWGTDSPLFSMAHQAGKVLFARIPDDAKRKILGGNAIRLFGLDRP